MDYLAKAAAETLKRKLDMLQKELDSKLAGGIGPAEELRNLREEVASLKRRLDAL